MSPTANLNAKLGLSLALATSLAACDSSSPITHAPGATSFESRAPGSSGGQNRAGGGPELADDQASAPPTAGESGAPRTVEEGDIVKLEGDTLYVLNRYRGLQIVDLSNPASPTLRSATPFYGAPIELYIRDGRAYVVVSDYWGWLPCINCLESSTSFRGSKVYVVDVADAAAPSVLSSLEIEGQVSNSRLVGDILYVVSNRTEYSGYGVYRGGLEDVAVGGGAEVAQTTNLTYVASISISNPTNPHQVSRLDFPRNGWDDHLNVTSDAIFIASPAWGWWGGTGECPNDQPCTKIRHVDISSPSGLMSLGGEVAVPGYVMDRWQLDFEPASQILRVALASFEWGTTAGPVVRTFSVAPGSLTALGEVEIPLHQPEQTTAVRFDGDKAYVVTFMQIDPLFVVDLSDPAQPYVAGSLETPGWLDYIEPRGDRLVALGHGQDQSNRWQLQVSLYDVSNPAAPVMIDREHFGGDWGWTPGARDDFQKVFRVLDDQNLILVPFTSWEQSSSYGWWGYLRGNVQLLDYDRNQLTLRGRVQQNGYTERALTLPGEKLVALSSEVVDVLDITDRDHPALDGSLELSRNVNDLAVEGDIAVEYVGDWYTGHTSLYVVPASDPNTTQPLATLEFPFMASRIFRNGSFAYVISQGSMTWPTDRAGGEDGSGDANANEPVVVPPRATVVDLSDPTNPQIRGTLDLPSDSMGTNYYWDWYWYSGEMVQVDGSLLAVHRASMCLAWDSSFGHCTSQIPDRITMIDFANPDQPVISGEVELAGADWMYGLTAAGRTLYISHYEYVRQVGNEWWVRYWLDRVDVTNPAAPVQLPSVNIPGWFLGASSDGSELYTQEYAYLNDQPFGVIHALELNGNVAQLASSVAISGWLGQLTFSGEHAYGTVYRAAADGTGTSSLVSVDLTDVSQLALAEAPLQGEGWSWYGAPVVAGNKLFASSYDSVVVFGLEDPMHPAFESFHRTHGYAGRIEVEGDTAYLPLGYAGVDVITLD